MTAIRYSYVSECCGHGYIEQRDKKELAYFTVCHFCGQGDYKLISSELVDG